MLNNAAATQLFSVPNHLIAKEWGDLLGMEPSLLTRLPREDAVVSVHGRGAQVVRRPDYLTDPLFAGRYDPNPRFTPPAESGQASWGWPWSR